MVALVKGNSSLWWLRGTGLLSVQTWTLSDVLASTNTVFLIRNVQTKCVIDIENDSSIRDQQADSLTRILYPTVIADSDAALQAEVECQK